MNDLETIIKTFLNENNCGANIYCFSQNNKGVLNQFFRKNNSEAKLYYNRACENGFPLAYYIRGFLDESEGDHDSTISDYKNASEIFENDYKFPIIRFACAAHTCQLLVEDLRKLNEQFNDSINYISEFISWIRRKK